MENETESPEIRVLLIEDSPIDTLYIQNWLSIEDDGGFHLTCADRLSTGLEYLTEKNGEVDIVIQDPISSKSETRIPHAQFDSIVLDLGLPDSKGFDTFLKVYSHAPETPILIYSGSEDEALAKKIVKSGAQDYLIKGQTDRILLIRALRYAIERKSAAMALETSRASFRAIVGKSIEGFIVVDMDGIILFLNTAAELIFNRKADELVGKLFGFALISGESTEIDIKRPGNKLGVGDMRCTETQWIGKLAHLVSIRDITDRKQIEGELREANRKILEQQKAVIEEERLKVLLQMSGATAHELNQPLTILLGNIELMMLKQNSPEQLSQFMEIIESAGQRIADIVRKIQNIRQDVKKPYMDKTSIINLNQKTHILSVEDSDDDFNKIEAILEDDTQITLSRANNIKMAIEFLQNNRTDIVLVDHVLPDGNSLDFLRSMGEEGNEIPAVIISGQGNEIIASNVIREGAYDYLPKYAINESLPRCIVNAMEKYRLKQEIKKAMDKMGQMAARDVLTGLYNRHYMNEILEQDFARTVRYKTDLSCILIDLDFFKEVNDTHGHTFGDFVLKEFGKCLPSYIRSSDLCFRYGGEEFLVLLPNTGIVGAKKSAENIRLAFEEKTFNDEDKSTSLTVSIGVASVHRHRPANAKDLLSFADKALYQAKADGRNRVKIYLEDSQMLASAKKTANLSDVQHIKQKISSIMEKTKQASLASLELLLRETDAFQLQKHNQKVLECMDQIGVKMHFPSAIVDTFKRAAKLHNCFKVVLRSSLLDKKGNLTEEEKIGIKDEPYVLNELTGLFDFFSNEREILYYHHERYDGSGYPDGLKGEQIPLGARIFSVVDAFVAMTSERPYREALSQEKVIEELVNNAGTQFDPSLISIFLDIIEKK